MTKKYVCIMCVLLTAVLTAAALFGCGANSPKDDTYGKNDDANAPETYDVLQSVQKVAAEVRSSSLSGLLGKVTVDGKLQGDTAALLPTDNTQPSKALAEQALLLCSDTDKGTIADYVVRAGFATDSVKQFGYDKPADEVSHTAAFTTATQATTYNGESRTLMLVSVRGSVGTEWYSNLDFAPSRNADTQFAENFLLAATDIYLTLCNEVKEMTQTPLFLVCGHSRGGAVANLLTVLLNEKYGNSNVFGYTFATPNTVKGTLNGVYDGNLFNYVYDCDIVCRMPFAEWGFSRLGTDVVLTNGSKDNQARNEAKSLATIATDCAADIDEYYTARWSLTEEGRSVKGITSFELFTAFVAAALSDGQAGIGNIDSSSLKSTTAKSHYAPLFVEILKFADNPLKAIAVATRHMPANYQQLIEGLK